MRILMVNLPFAGHTNPTLPLAAALTSAGHEVTCVNAEPFRRAIEATGAHFVPYRDFPANPTEEDKKRRSFRALWNTALGLGKNFDLLLYEMFFYPGFTLAQKLGIPAVRQFSQPAWSVEGWLNRPFRFRLQAQMLDQQIMSEADRLSMEQRDRSLSGANLNDRPALNVVYLPEEMQDDRGSFDGDWVFLPPPVPEDEGPDFLPWAELPRPIVYVSLGSVMSDRGFCRQIIKGFGGKDMTVILNTGRVDPATLGRLPENIRAYSFLPQAAALRHADVFLTHCGMNSVNEALACGVPMAAMPVMSDQPVNAARLAELGLAKRVRTCFGSGRQMYEVVSAVAKDAEMRRRMAEMQASYCRQQDMEGLVKRIEALGGQA